MGKIEQVYLYQGQKYFFSTSINGVKVYSDEHDQQVLLCDKDNNVLCTIEARCAQNEGFLDINVVEK